MSELACYQPPLAARWTRLGAAAVDALLLLPGVAALLVGLVTHILAQFEHYAVPLKPVGDGLDMTAVGGALIVGVLLLQTAMMYVCGQTVGKKLLRIRVVRGNGQPSGFVRLVLLRGMVMSFVGLLAFPVGFMLALLSTTLIFRADRRCLHDLLADTVVVQAE